MNVIFINNVAILQHDALRTAMSLQVYLAISIIETVFKILAILKESKLSLNCEQSSTTMVEKGKHKLFEDLGSTAKLPES